MQAVPRLCRFYPGICCTTEKKARKNFGQGSHNTSVTLLNRNKTVYTLLKKYCDSSTRKIHINNNFILSISHLIMFDTLLLRPSLHCNTPLHFTTHFIQLYFTTLHPTTLHYTYRHFTSSNLHFTTLSFSFTHLHFLSFYFTSHH